MPWIPSAQLSHFPATPKISHQTTLQVLRAKIPPGKLSTQSKSFNLTEKYLSYHTCFVNYERKFCLIECVKKPGRINKMMCSEKNICLDWIIQVWNYKHVKFIFIYLDCNPTVNIIPKYCKNLFYSLHPFRSAQKLYNFLIMVLT